MASLQTENFMFTLYTKLPGDRNFISASKKNADNLEMVDNRKDTSNEHEEIMIGVLPQILILISKP